MSVQWSVSFRDVELAQAQNGNQNLERTLYDLGMDTKQGFLDDGRWKVIPKGEEDVDEFGYFHRSLSGERVCGPRYLGVARQDGKWKALISNELNLTPEFGMGA